MASDLTIIFLTSNEHPEGWVSYHKDVLMEAVQKHKLITVSRNKEVWKGVQADIHDTEPKSHLNMYKQLLNACKLATTPYIATAEDDALYPKEHFSFYRPPLDTIMYDRARWSLYWWTPIYSVKQRISNCTLIAPRLEYIDALEEKISKLNGRNLVYVGEVGRHEYTLKLKPRKIETKVYCSVPTIHFNSPNGTDIKMGTRKRLGEIKAYNIPYWGEAQSIIDKYK